MSTSWWMLPVRQGVNVSKAAAYLDYQGSTPVDPRVRDALIEALSHPGNASAEDHAFGWAAARRIEDARESVAQAIGALEEEVTFTSGATEANNLAILGAALGAPADRRRVLVSAIEHKSVLAPAQALSARGFSVELVPVGPDGLVDPGELRSRMAPDVAVVSIMAVNNEIGTIQPVADLTEVAHEFGAFFHVDATQALCAQSVDVLQWKVDALSVSGHKIYAPCGIGALFVALEAPWRPQPLVHGGGQERGLRAGTVPAALCAALGEACRLIVDEGAKERAAVAALRNGLESALRGIFPALKVTCATSPRHPGALHVRFPGIDAADLLTRLQPRVGASTGSACNSGIIGPSHVPLALGMSQEEAAQCVRFSVGRFSGPTDVEIAIDALRSVLLKRAA